MGKQNIEIINATVGHSRQWPKKNTFKYRVFYVKIPIVESLTKKPVLFSFNKFNVLSMRTKDHGSRRSNKDWYEFITGELTKANIPTTKDYHYYLIAHPRILGYAFNPISYWLVVNDRDELQAVLCEVHNTFKQTHNYLLTKKNGAPILPKDILIADKKLYVSPFNKIEGHYEFSFSYTSVQFKSVINYFDDQGKHILNTYVGGSSQVLTSRGILRVVLLYPFMTFLVVIRIHWQAVKLYLKKVNHTLHFKPDRFRNNQTTVSKKEK